MGACWHLGCGGCECNGVVEYARAANLDSVTAKVGGLRGKERKGCQGRKRRLSRSSEMSEDLLGTENCPQCVRPRAYWRRVLRKQ